MVSMDVFEKCIEFKERTGRWPRRTIKINNVRVSKKSIKEHYDEGLIDFELYQELMEEATLSNRWLDSPEYKLLKKYSHVPIEKIPQEYVETVKKLRSAMPVVKSKERATIQDYIDFVQREKREPMLYENPTEVQIKEHKLMQMWRVSKECAIYNKYKGIMIYEVPEEDREIVRQIRSLWIDVDGMGVARDVVKFVKKNKREPRLVIPKVGKENSGLTKQEQEEILLCQKWNRCFEKQVIDRFIGVPLREIPYEYKKIVGKLRRYDLGFKETFDTRMYIKFIRDNGTLPRKSIIINNEVVKEQDLTKDELIEVRIRRKWDMSEDKKVYERYKAGVLDKKTEKMYESMLADLDEAYKPNRHTAKKTSSIRNKGIVAIEDETLATKLKQLRDDSDKKNKELEKKEYGMKVAELYIAFIKEHGRLPGTKVESKNGECDELMEKEGLLKYAWKRCNFISTIEAYAGTPIESVPVEYRKIIADFRSEGFGLTWDEYYKYRSTRNPKEVLKIVKRSRDLSMEKKQKAIELEEEMLAYMRGKLKERDDE